MNIWHPPTFDICHNFSCKRNYVLKQVPTPFWSDIIKYAVFFLKASLRSDLNSSVLRHWNRQLEPYWFPLSKNSKNLQSSNIFKEFLIYWRIFLFTFGPFSIFVATLIIVLNSEATSINRKLFIIFIYVDNFPITLFYADAIIILFEKTPWSNYRGVVRNVWLRHSQR